MPVIPAIGQGKKDRKISTVWEQPGLQGELQAGQGQIERFVSTNKSSKE